MMRFCPRCSTQLWAVGDPLAGYYRCDCGWVSEDWPHHDGEPLNYVGRSHDSLIFQLELGPI